MCISQIIRHPVFFLNNKLKKKQKKDHTAGEGHFVYKPKYILFTMSLPFSIVFGIFKQTVKK